MKEVEVVYILLLCQEFDVGIYQGGDARGNIVIDTVDNRYT